MKYVKAAEFKATCLRVMDEIAETGEEVVVTKHGKPVARVGPPPTPASTPDYFGWAHGTVVVTGDILVPIDVAGWTLDGVPWNEVFPDVDFAPPSSAPLLSDGEEPRD